MVLALLPTYAYAENEAYEPALSGYEKTEDILSATFDEATSINGVANACGTVTGTTSRKIEYNNKLAAGTYTIEPAPVDAEAHGPALKLITEAGTNFKEYLMGWYSLTEKGAVVYQGDFLFKDFAGSRRILEPVFVSANMAGSWGVGAPFIVEANGEGGIARLPGKSKALAKNTWYTFAAVVNMDEGLTTYFIDGEAIATENFRSKYVEGKTPKINRARIRMTFKNGEEQTTEGMYLDNMKTIHYAKRPTIESVTCNETNTQVEITVSEALNAATVSADSVKLLTNDAEVSLASVTYENKKIIVTPTAALGSSMLYTVRLTESVTSSAGLPLGEADREKSFTTQAASFDVLSVSCQNGTVSAVLQNKTGEAKTAVMVVVLQNAAGNIIGCRYSAETEISSDAKELQVQTESADATSCEVFFLDGWENRLLIKNYVYTISCSQ